MTAAAASPPAITDSADDGAWGRWAPSLASVAIVAATCAPSVVAALAVVGERWFASSDQALELLRIADVGGRHSPLLGVYSRWGWAHPGPMLFWVLAPFERIGGQTGVLVGTGLINAAAAGAAGIAALRARGMRLAVVTAVVFALLQLGLGVDRLVDPWNPTVALVPFASFGVMCWLATLGRPWLLAAAVVIGTFSLQAHVGYVLLVGMPLAVTAIVVVSRPSPFAPRSEERRQGRRVAQPLLAAVAAGLVLWAPTVWQQLTGDPGNLTAIARYARAPQEPPVGLGEALGSFGAHLRPLGPWATGRDTDDLNLALTGGLVPAVGMLMAIGLLSIAAWRRRSRAGTFELAGLVVLMVPLAIFGSARVTGLYAPYVVLFWRGVGALGALALLWPLATLVVATRGRWVRPAVVAAILAGSITAAIAQLPVRVPLPEVSAALADIVPEVEAALDRDRRYLVRGQDVRTFLAPISGLHVNLERRGWDVYVDPDPLSPLTVGERRTAEEHEVDAELFIVDLTSVYGGFEPAPGSRTIASYDPLTAAERSELLQLESRIRTDLGEAGPSEPLFVQNPWFRNGLVARGASRDDVERLAQLHARGDGYFVYLRDV